MSWLRRHRYAVAGVPPTGTTDGWDGYRGASLADRPVVAAALDRAPRFFTDLVYEPGSTELALSTARLLENVTVATRDGVAWELSLGDDVKPVIDTGPDALDENLERTAWDSNPRAGPPLPSVFEAVPAACSLVPGTTGFHGRSRSTPPAGNQGETDVD